MKHALLWLTGLFLLAPQFIKGTAESPSRTVSGVPSITTTVPELKKQSIHCPRESYRDTPEEMARLEAAKQDCLYEYREKHKPMRTQQTPDRARSYW